MRYIFASMIVFAMVLGVSGMAHAEDMNKKVSTVVSSESKKAEKTAKKGKKKAAEVAASAKKS